MKVLRNERCNSFKRTKQNAMTRWHTGIGTMLQRMLRLSLSITLVYLCGCAASSVARNRHNSPALTPAAVAYLQHSAEAVRTLQAWYTPSTGLYQTTGW
jgi:hypothetical protein